MGSCFKKEKQPTNMLLVIVIPETMNSSSHALFGDQSVLGISISSGFK